jgi:hypothetical protein
MGMRYMNSRAQVAIERLHLGERKQVVEGRQSGVRVILANEQQNSWRLSQDAAVGNQSRNPALGIDRQVLGLALAVVAKSTRTVS